MCLINFDEIDL